MKKTHLIFTVFTVLLITLSWTDSILAKDYPSSTRPNVNYGSTSPFSRYEFSGPWQLDKWNHIAGYYQYDSWDRDIYRAYNAVSNVTLSTESESEYRRSGSTRFNFKEIAELNLQGSVGQKWRKSTTVNFDAARGYTYELWGANRVHVKEFELKREILWNYLTYEAQLYDRDGSVKWFFRYRT